MDRPNHTVKPLPHDPQQLLQMGLQLGNFITANIFDRPLNEQDVPEPWPCSRTLKFKTEPKEIPQ